jgi:DNA ligase-1
MDGVRAYWNGRKLISRHGKEYICPAWFVEGLPQELSLDGELWLGRGAWEALMAILNVDSQVSNWKAIKYKVFDLPGSKDPYETRCDHLRQLTLPPHASVIDIEACTNNGQLRNILAQVVSNGGEGLMAIRPESLYTAGRSDALLKVKVSINIVLIHEFSFKRMLKSSYWKYSQLDFIVCSI